MRKIQLAVPFFLFLFLIITIMPAHIEASTYFAICDGVILEKKSTKQQVCVFEESVQKLIDRGYASPVPGHVKYVGNQTQVKSCTYYTLEEHPYFEFAYDGCYGDIRVTNDICVPPPPTPENPENFKPYDIESAYSECSWVAINE